MSTQAVDAAVNLIIDALPERYEREIVAIRRTAVIMLSASTVHSHAAWRDTIDTLVKQRIEIQPVGYVEKARMREMYTHCLENIRQDELDAARRRYSEMGVQ